MRERNGVRMEEEEGKIEWIRKKRGESTHARKKRVVSGPMRGKRELRMEEKEGKLHKCPQLHIYSASGWQFRSKNRPSLVR
jgi:hypothetical protein